MPRLIDADALARKWQYVLDVKAEEKYSVAYTIFELLIEGLKEEPTIDPESLRPHGRWEKSEDGYCGLALLECSLCRGECFDIDEDIELVNYRYCPNCGAKMDEEEDDE